MKRKRPAGGQNRLIKRQKIESPRSVQTTFALLQKYYTRVQTLRTYLASRATSARKASKINAFGTRTQDGANSLRDLELNRLLDSTLVGTNDNAEHNTPREILSGAITIFTQQVVESSTLQPSPAGKLTQSEIVDFTIWSIFRTWTGPRAPRHLLCQGLKTNVSGAGCDAPPVAAPGVPGVFEVYRNPHVSVLKQSPWTLLHELLGGDAESLIHNMLMSAGVFVPLADKVVFKQLSGVPLMDVAALPQANRTNPQQNSRLAIPKSNKPTNFQSTNEPQRLSSIRFSRHRMLYARAELHKGGNVRFCLPRKHVLERYRDLDDSSETLHLMKYVFPRQFGLHNVFTSPIESKLLGSASLDYTDREAEISRARYDMKRAGTKIDTERPEKIPKRLRGLMKTILSQARKRYRQCSMLQLLRHYCPRETGFSSQSIQNATSPAQVSAFCRAYTACIFPVSVWGGLRNFHHLKQSIDAFVRLRRFETMSIHDVIQGLELRAIPWLQMKNGNASHGMSASDAAKRTELLAEILYYLFDSFIIPLIRSCFHVTESNVNRNGLCYFRHDVWQMMTEPVLAALKQDMFEEILGMGSGQEGLAKRQLGLGRVRLLPKASGMRPILNLRRREAKRKNGMVMTTKSVNTILTPAFSVLNLEKANAPSQLGSALFSVDEIFTRLQQFKSSLQTHGLSGRPLWFAKVDVRACFDTIPQERMLSVISRVLKSQEYRVARYARAKLIRGHRNSEPGQGLTDFGAKAAWRYFTRAAQGHGGFDMDKEIMADVLNSNSPSVYVDNIVQWPEHRKAILALLKEHISANLVQFGGKVYRQKTGIPQGSILSSLLCAYFYSDMEERCLAFTRKPGCLLMRLVDDFILISTEQRTAKRFLLTMQQGMPEYGLEIQTDKSRVNFDFKINGRTVPNNGRDRVFPYCGHAINTTSLDIEKDHARRVGRNLIDSVTVEYSKAPGQVFYRKTLHALKLQMRSMLLSTAHNQLSTVLSNLFHAFMEVAQKTFFYIRCLPAAKQPDDKIIIRALDDMIKLSCSFLGRRDRKQTEGQPSSICGVKAVEARWLACAALLYVFQRRQTKHGTVVRWLSEQIKVAAVNQQTNSLTRVAETYLRRWTSQV